MDGSHLQDKEHLRLRTPFPHDVPIFHGDNSHTHTTKQIHKQCHEQRDEMKLLAWPHIEDWNVTFLQLDLHKEVEPFLSEEAQLVSDRWQHKKIQYIHIHVQKSTQDCI